MSAMIALKGLFASGILCSKSFKKITRQTDRQIVCSSLVPQECGIIKSIISTSIEKSSRKKAGFCFHGNQTALKKLSELILTKNM